MDTSSQNTIFPASLLRLPAAPPSPPSPPPATAPALYVLCNGFEFGFAIVYQFRF
jgi:hypothetical protein